MTRPFQALNFQDTRDLLLRVHSDDPICTPGVILRLLVGLTEAEVAAARWGHFHPLERRLEIPTRHSGVDLRRPEWGWLDLYRPAKFRPEDPICPLSPQAWAARLGRLAPGYTPRHLRRSWLYYQEAARRTFRADRSIPLAQDPRMAILRLSLLHPANFHPPVDPPVYRQSITPVAPSPAPMTITGLDLV